MVSLCWGVCKASRWRHRATVRAHRHACARNTVTLQLQDGGYALLWHLWLLLLMLVRFKLIAKNINRVYCCCCRCILHIQQYSLDWTCFFMKCLLASRLTPFRLYTWLWFRSCNQRNLASFLSCRNRKHSSWNHGLCCVNSWTLSLFSWGLAFF